LHSYDDTYPSCVPVGGTGQAIGSLGVKILYNIYFLFHAAEPPVATAFSDNSRIVRAMVDAIFPEPLSWENSLSKRLSTTDHVVIVSSEEISRISVVGSAHFPNVWLSITDVSICKVLTEFVFIFFLLSCS